MQRSSALRRLWADWKSWFTIESIIEIAMGTRFYLLENTALEMLWKVASWGGEDNHEREKAAFPGNLLKCIYSSPCMY